jgi:hypothetical protein
VSPRSVLILFVLIPSLQSYPDSSRTYARHSSSSTTPRLLFVDHGTLDVNCRCWRPKCSSSPRVLVPGSAAVHVAQGTTDGLHLLQVWTEGCVLPRTSGYC